MAFKKRVQSQAGTSSDGSDEVPVELTDEDDPLWYSESRCRKWLAEQGLDIRRQFAWGPKNRCWAAGEAWAIQHGVVRSVSWGRGVAPDYERMRELGLRAGSSSAARYEERFASMGITIKGPKE